MTFPIRHKLISLFFSPWFPFSVFLLAHTLLSHFPLDWKSKFWISIGGLFIPFFLLLLLNHPHPPEEQKNLKEKLDMIFPSFFWILLLLAAIFERFYRLTTLSTWPLADEGYLGGFAVELSEKWKWHLLYGYVQFPPLHFWCLGLFFKIFGPSLRNLWLFPALLSLLTLPLVYLASRRFFPKSLCVVMTAFWAFGFWPLFLDRLCLPQGLLVLWQLAAFIALGHFLRQETPSSKKWSAFILGFLTGTGFYTLLHWAFMAFWTALIVGYHTFQKAFKQPEPFLFFLFPVILFPLPLLVVFLTGKHGSYLHHVSIFNHDFSWQYQIRIWWNYLCGLFWGVQTGQYNYKPIWGGFLNPVAGSLFFLGFAEVCREIRKGMNVCILLGFVLFILPAFLTRDLEMLRMILALPLLMAVCAMGAQKLLYCFHPPAQKILWIALLTLLAVLDFYHLEGPYQRLWRLNWVTSLHYTKSLERWQAFQILSSMKRKSGPGIVLTEFDPTPFDQTLTTALYPFNAARNPAFSPFQAQWAGLLTNINYSPFLAKRFPDSKWFSLAPGQDSSDGTLVLGIIPMDSVNQEILIHWLEIERALRSETSQWLQLPLGQTNAELTQSLYQIRLLANKDPFLESCLGERIFYCEMTGSNSNGVLMALHRALTLGYPAANLYNDLGVYWFTAGDPAKAREAFNAALRCPINHTSAWANLQKIPRP